MAAAAARARTARLPPEVNRVLYVRNLPFSISAEDLYEIFGRYGAIRQIRVGASKETRGTGYVVYEDVYDAREAAEHLSGFNVQNRYLIVTYHSTVKQGKKLSLKEQEQALREMQARHGVDGEQHAAPAAAKQDGDGGGGGGGGGGA